MRLQGSGERYNRLCSLNPHSPLQNWLCVPKYNVMINYHTSRKTMANRFTWEEGGSDCHVYTRGLFFRDVGKCEAEWPSLAPPLWLWDFFLPFLVTSLAKYMWKKRLEDVSSHHHPQSHRVSHTQAIFLRAELLCHKALGVRAWLTHPPHFTSYIPLQDFLRCSLYKPVVGETATRSTDSMPWVLGVFSETYSHDNAGLTTTASEIHYQALQLVKTNKIFYRLQTLLWTKK